MVMTMEQYTKLNLTLTGHVRVKFFFFMEAVIESSIEQLNNHVEQIADKPGEIKKDPQLHSGPATKWRVWEKQS